MDKKVVIFSALYLPSAYGVERYTYNLADKLSKKGHKVKIITCNVFNLKYYEKIDNVEVFRVPCFKLLGGRFPVTLYSKKLRNALKDIKKEETNLVIINTRFYVNSLVGALFSRFNRYKSIVIEHGTSHFSVNSTIFDFLGHIYEHFITFIIKRCCNNFYGVSKACNKWLAHFNINPKGVLYNSINIDFINKIQIEKDSYRHKYNINSNDILIVFVGRLVEEKGIIQLINGFKLLLKKQNNVHLFVAGDGLLFDDIMKIKNSNIHILGKIEFENVIRLLKESDVYCLPTEYAEGFPTSLLEAAATKNFIVTTDKGGSKELIKDDSYGIILDNINEKTIEKALSKCLNNKEYRNKAINKAYDRLIENFEWEKTCKKVIDIINESSK